MSVMHLWCFVLACKKTGYWTRRAVLIIASEAEEYADPHTKTHTQKKKVLLVVVLWFHPVGCLSQMRDATNCPQLHFFCTLPVPSLFFALCPSHRFFFAGHIVFFFALCLSHCIFFCTLPVPSLFFLTLCRSHRFFFCTLSVTSHVFCNLVVASFFFCNPLSQLHFFCNGKIGDPSVAFFLQDVSASLDCCNSGCISVCTFAFILHFFRFFSLFFTL